MENNWSSKFQAFKDEAYLKKAGSDLADKARSEVYEDRIRKRYEKKLGVFENYVKQAVESFRVKELQLIGSLDEARREIAEIKSSYYTHENALKEEIFAINRRASTYKAELLQLQEERYYHKKWKKDAVNLASIIIQACSTVRQLPAREMEEGSSNEESEEEKRLGSHVFESVFNDLMVSSTSRKKKKKALAAARIYNLFSDADVLIDKRAIKKALGASKKVFERAKYDVEDERERRKELKISAYDDYDSF